MSAAAVLPRRRLIFCGALSLGIALTLIPIGNHVYTRYVLKPKPQFHPASSITLWFPDRWVPLGPPAPCPGKFHLSKMSTFITFTLGYCIYQSIRSVKSLFRCEWLCRAGHCVHRLHDNEYSSIGRFETSSESGGGGLFHMALDAGAAIMLFSLRFAVFALMGWPANLILFQ